MPSFTIRWGRNPNLHIYPLEQKLNLSNPDLATLCVWTSVRLFSRSTLPEAKFERLVSLSSAYFFLFWFVCSFCVFNLLHAFKSLALFPPSGKTVARYFGATSGLRVLCTRRPTQIRLRTKRKNEQEDFSHVRLSK